MIPWQELGRARVPDGELVLSRRGDEYAIRLRGAELMNSRSHHSEEQLAVLGCAGIVEPGATILIGGLGMGFTTRAALDALPADARVVVAELVPEVVVWNRGPLASLAREPLDDPRVSVEIVDVTTRISTAGRRAFAAILLDVDNGPDAFTAASNDRLYGVRGLERARHALSPGGVFGVWSVADDTTFTGRLRGVGFSVEQHRVPARQGAGAKHVVWIARTPRG